MKLDTFRCELCGNAVEAPGQLCGSCEEKADNMAGEQARLSMRIGDMEIEINSFSLEDASDDEPVVKEEPRIGFPMDYNIPASFRNFIKDSFNIGHKPGDKCKDCGFGYPKPKQLKIFCPVCNHPHIDEGEWAKRIHFSHKCDKCNHVWRLSNLPTVGVK